MRVKNKNNNMIGLIKRIEGNTITVDFRGNIIKYSFPSSFANFLELEDGIIQNEVESYGEKSAFDDFRKKYKVSLKNEIDFLKSTGGRKYKIVDGELIQLKNDYYLYAFDTDSDLNMPDGTAIKLWFPNNIVLAYIVSCEEFSIVFRTKEYIGERIAYVDFTSEQWQLLEALNERLDNIDIKKDAIAYEIACTGKKQISKWQGIICGQKNAYDRALKEKITFIWGPPGTGKTEALAVIALGYITNRKRVLMLSHSNVSVDGAVLRIANKVNPEPGMIVRYGYPKSKEILDSKNLSSYQCVLNNNPELMMEYNSLINLKRKTNKKDTERIEINKKLNKLRDYLLDEEKKLINNAPFVATTVSKAIVDKAIYEQKFDAVIFDEASMAYVPQIVFSASMAKTNFVCMGDFCQLPAMAQNDSDELLTRDIFEYTGITHAVESNQKHEWLVMLDLQYRMHHSIADFVSENMYFEKLNSSDKIQKKCDEITMLTPCPGKAMTLISLSGMYSVCIKNKDGSRINLLSALISIRLAEKYIKRYDVGIITPYNAQSRLILSIIRDLQNNDKKWEKVACATVHQFQGSEKSIIIYDSVDCFRMAYPGSLLTSMKNDTANRLFNVAITRAKGKFVIIANTDYFKRKQISKKLLFSKALKKINVLNSKIEGRYVLDEIMPQMNENPSVFSEDRENSWDIFIKDINFAKTDINIDIPDLIDDSDDLRIGELLNVLKKKKKDGVNICIRVPEEVELPKGLREFIKPYEYVANPVTIIDKSILWFGQPLYASEFISEGEIIDTDFFPCFRIEGNNTAKIIRTLLDI